MLSLDLLRTLQIALLSLQAPVQIFLGTHQASEGPCCALKEVKDTFIYIPLLQVIESLLIDVLLCIKR